MTGQAASGCQDLGKRQESNSNLVRIILSEQKASIRGPAVFIDRDGVINVRRPGDYVLNWSQFVFVPGMRTTLKQIASLGFPMIVISNQAAVGKGLLDIAGLQEITTQMYQTLAADGTLLSAAYYCPHRADENCACRKPQPGLLQTAAQDFNVDLSRSLFIGDSETDVQAARAAGCAPLLFSADDPQSRELLTAREASDLFAVVKNYLRANAHGHRAVSGVVVRPPAEN